MDYSKVGAQSGQQVYWSLIRALKSFPYAKQLETLKNLYPDITQTEIEYYIGTAPKPVKQYVPEGYVVVDIEGDFSWDAAIAAGIFSHADDKNAYDMGVNFQKQGAECNIRHLYDGASKETIEAIQDFALLNNKAILVPIDEVVPKDFESKGVYNIVTNQDNSQQTE